MHDPIALDALRRPALVKHEGLLHPDILGPTVDRLVGSGGFPVPRHGSPVRALPIGVLPVSRAKEVPLVLAELRFLYNPTKLTHMIKQPCTTNIRI